MNRLVEQDRDGGHLTWSHAESSPPPGAPSAWRHKVNDGEGATKKRRRDYPREFPDHYCHLKSPTNGGDTQHTLLSS